jgi:1-acyl-sn-glycerol-3-phosphate acyltransferase
VLVSNRLDLRVPADSTAASAITDLPHLHSVPANRAAALRSVRSTGAWFLRRHWKVQCHGEENIPSTGPAILAANHLGVLDGPLLVAMTRRTTFALAKSTLFTGQVGRGLEIMGQIPVRQGGINTLALRRAIRVLDQGYLLGIFPEGSRHTGDMRKIFGGAAYLAMVTGAPILPVALLGTREPGQTISDLPRRGAPIHIVYGEPIAIDRIPWPRRRPAVAECTEQVRRRLAAHVAWAEGHTGMALPGVPAPKVRASA